MSAPWRARRRTIALPMPREPPVTRAVLPDRSIMLAPSWATDGRRGWRPSAYRLVDALRLARDNVGQVQLNGERAGEDLGEDGRDGVDRVPVDGHPHVHVLGPDGIVGVATACGVCRPLHRHGTGREARPEGAEHDPVDNMHPALV